MTSFFDINKAALTTAVAASFSYADVLRRLGRAMSGNNRPALKRAIDKFELSVSHFNIHKASVETKINKWPKNARPLTEILKINVHYSTSNLRIRLLKTGLLKNICSICSSPPIWNNKHLTLQLDHINGVRSDNRITNLRIVCPNCHTQTDTFAGKISKTIDVLPTIRVKVKVRIRVNQIKKIKWPSSDILQEKLWAQPVSKLALELGVSGTAIKKHCTKLGISTPARGYWQKLASATSLKL